MAQSGDPTGCSSRSQAAGGRRGWPRVGSGQCWVMRTHAVKHLKIGERVLITRRLPCRSYYAKRTDGKTTAENRSLFAANEPGISTQLVDLKVPEQRDADVHMNLQAQLKRLVVLMYRCTWQRAKGKFGNWTVSFGKPRDDVHTDHELMSNRVISTVTLKFPRNKKLS